LHNGGGDLCGSMVVDQFLVSFIVRLYCCCEPVMHKYLSSTIKCLIQLKAGFQIEAV